MLAWIVASVTYLSQGALAVPIVRRAPSNYTHGSLAVSATAQLRATSLSEPATEGKHGSQRSSETKASRPHILLLLLDDVGWSEVGWNRKNQSEVKTPNMDSLVADGIELQRHYVHQFCSPSRCAIQSGRAPIHVNVINPQGTNGNPADPISGFAGIPRNMTGIAEVLRGAGYRTHMVGKWDAGMATAEHTPAGKGYETSLSYFGHHNDCWTYEAATDGGCSGNKPRDLWDMSGDIPFPGKPAAHIGNNGSCSYENQSPKDGSVCVYEEALFERRVTDIIMSHNPVEPLFLFWSTRGAHGPNQPPESEMAKFMQLGFQREANSYAKTDWLPKDRQKYSATVSWIDGAVGRVVDALKSKSMFDQTLIVMSSDNGATGHPSSNYPLKGGKFANWEGGIRVPAFVSGGFLPKAVRGSKQTALIAAWDWYATFAGLAGADPTDAKAAAAGLPAHDSIDQWPLLTGATTEAPRQLLEIGSNEGGNENRLRGATRVGGVIMPPYKLLTGHGPGETINFAAWSLPHASLDREADRSVEVCGRTPQTGCLFDIFSDPSERVNLAAEKPDLFYHMLAKVDHISKSVFSPDRGADLPVEVACNKMDKFAGYLGPWFE